MKSFKKFLEDVRKNYAWDFEEATAMRINQNKDDSSEDQKGGIRRLSSDRAPLVVIAANDAEQSAHQTRLDIVQKEGGHCLWRAE